MCLLAVGRCPNLGYIREVSSVLDEEDSVGIRGVMRIRQEDGVQDGDRSVAVQL
jgi:hypothetical protein